MTTLDPLVQLEALVSESEFHEVRICIKHRGDTPLFYMHTTYKGTHISGESPYLGGAIQLCARSFALAISLEEDALEDQREQLQEKKRVLRYSQIKLVGGDGEVK